MAKLEKDLNALVIIILSGVLLSAFGVQFIWHEEPCPLCLLQRVGMVGVAASLLLNLWFGIRTAHYGLAILSSLVGGFVALRQVSLHVCPGFPEFGVPVLGISLYTWSFFVFVCCVAAIAAMLFLYDPKESEGEPMLLDFLGKTAFTLIFLVTVANVIATLNQCGLGVCTD